MHGESILEFQEGREAENQEKYSVFTLACKIINSMARGAQAWGVPRIGDCLGSKKMIPVLVDS